MKSSIVNNTNQIHSLWDNYESFVAVDRVRFPAAKLQEMITSLFCPGPSYYYVIDFSDRQITYIHPAVKKILGLDPETLIFSDILSRIHPDDVGHVLQCEKKLLDYMYDHAHGNLINYVLGYCFRFKVADGSYQLFHHQAVILAADDNGKCSVAMNVHTNIHHLTTINNYKATLMGILGREDFQQFDMGPAVIETSLSTILSSREMEIITLAARGMKNTAIANELFISAHTVKTHRKNILHKTGAQTFSELIARCMREKLL